MDEQRVENLIRKIDEYGSGLLDKLRAPILVVSQAGKIRGANRYMDQVFPYSELTDYDFYGLTGITIEQILEAARNDKPVTIDRNERTFRMFSAVDEPDPDIDIFIIFEDITELCVTKKKYEEEKVCIAVINIDNYDELKANMTLDERLPIWTEADKAIRAWSKAYSGSLIDLGSSSYMMLFPAGQIEKIKGQQFNILDDIRAIESPNDFPMSLSIGVGAGGEDFEETREFANAALDLALGRGGDQAVIRTGRRVEYFGGASRTVEKENRGKARVIAHALIRLIDQAERVVIMGHHLPDNDAFGAAVGIARLCQMRRKHAAIVIGELHESMETLYKMFRDTDAYDFVSPERALEITDDKTLLVVVDTHRPGYTECPELLSKTAQVAVIDHHRKAADSIQDPVLYYLESYASSTCELVTEILRYAEAKKPLTKLEAEALLAGITIDTNHFSAKTGVRTFEAASWLRRAGADTTAVKLLFQSDMKEIKTRAQAITNAKFYEDGIAMSKLDGFNGEAQILNSQIADELLNVKGVRASFVAGRDETGVTLVSARSLGEINVQVIMEKFGGGGHLMTAGTQSDDSPEEILDQIRQILTEKEESESEKGSKT